MELRNKIKQYWPFAAVAALAIGAYIFWPRSITPEQKVIQELRDSFQSANAKDKATINALEKEIESLTRENSKIDFELQSAKNAATTHHEKTITRWRNATVPEIEQYFTERYPDSSLTSFKGN